jgi:uncharacterized protein (TIGR03382 family)
VQTEGEVQFSASAADQFGQPLSIPPTFSWVVGGGGSMSASGRFRAGTSPGGPFTVTASAAGAHGVAQVTVEASEGSDIAAPSVSLTAPKADALVSGRLRLEAEASDDVGVVAVTFTREGQVLGTRTTPPWTLEVDTGAWAVGTHALRASARDAAGNEAHSQPVQVEVAQPPRPDTRAPEVALVAPQAGTQAGPTLRLVAEASDDVGVASVTFTRNGQSLGTSTGAPWELLVETAGWTAGTHVLEALARDAAGNVSRSTSVTVRVGAGPASGDVEARPAGGCSAAPGGLLSLGLLALGLVRRRRRR